MQLDNHQQLHDTFIEFYIDQEHILLEKDLQKFCLIFLEFCIDQEYKKYKKELLKASSYIY